MKRGTITPLQYADALLEQAEKLDKLNAFIYLNPDEVRTAAEAATRKIASGETTGALIGLPLLVKDSVDTAGIATTGGTPSLSHNVPARNAEVLQLLLDEGAYVFGKTNLAEMSSDVFGANDYYGFALNPYDTSRIPGGSSTGTAVAVSARIGPMGIGEDTVGSIRLPSALTGLVGFRPTPGRYPNSGIVPLAPHRDTPGPMVRSMSDAVLFDRVVTGSSSALTPVDLAGLRLGVLPSFWATVDPEVEAVLQETLALLEDRGVVLVRQDIPGLLDLVGENYVTDSFCAHFDAISNYLSDHGLGFDYYALVDSVVTPQVKTFLSLGFPGVIPAEQCDRALTETRPTVQAMYAQYFVEHDVTAIIAPAVVIAAIPIGAQTVFLGGQERDALPWLVASVEPAAFAGLPSLTLPVGLTQDEKLPVGLLIDGPAGEDRKVLAIGEAIERIIPSIPPPQID